MRRNRKEGIVQLLIQLHEDVVDIGCRIHDQLSHQRQGARLLRWSLRSLSTKTIVRHPSPVGTSGRPRLPGSNSCIPSVRHRSMVHMRQRQRRGGRSSHGTPSPFVPEDWSVLSTNVGSLCQSWEKASKLFLSPVFMTILDSAVTDLEQSREACVDYFSSALQLALSCGFWTSPHDELGLVRDRLGPYL